MFFLNTFIDKDTKIDQLTIIFFIFLSLNFLISRVYLYQRNGTDKPANIVELFNKK